MSKNKRKIKKQTLIVLMVMLSISFILACYLIFNLPTKEDNEWNKTYCKQEQRGIEACTMDYNPVCGWFNQSIKCFKYPCAQTFSNICSACTNPTVEFHTPGECPK